MKERVYVSSAFANRERLAKEWIPALEAKGYEVVSTWHKEEEGNGRRYRRYAQRDVEELRKADTILVFTENHEESHGGMWVEFGFGLALLKRLVVIGPTPACVFVRLAHVDRIASLNDFLYGGNLD